jgi:hypothetical protein
MTQIILSNRYVEKEQPGENRTSRSAASPNTALASNVTLVSTRQQYSVGLLFFILTEEKFVGICFDSFEGRLIIS